MTTSASDRAQQVAGTAADEGKHVAGTAKDEAAKVASEAKGQARNLVSEATSQVDEQSRVQKDRLAETLHSFGDDLNGMASDRNGLAADLTQQVGQRAQDLATQIGSKDPQDLLEDVRGFARRKPGLFLLGSLAAGVAAGRFLRGARDAQSGGSPDAATAPAFGVGTAPGAAFPPAPAAPLPAETTTPETAVPAARPGYTAPAPSPLTGISTGDPVQPGVRP